MLVAAAATYGAATSPVLGFRTLAIEGTRFTSQEAIRGALGVGPDTNLVGLATDALRGRLVALPTVRDASVGVSLPDTIRVSVVERVPLLAWAVGEQRFLVDENGHVFAALPAGGADPAVAAAVRGLPVVTDQRAAASAIAVGAALDPVDFDVARRLGALTPANVGSGAAGLVLTVTDADGFVLSPRTGGWSAVFGFYTPTLRPPDLIPDQVRLLRSLLGTGEAAVGRVVLATPTDGTYVPRATPTPAASASHKP
jgi:POTRA domain-containing FtsQ-type protein